MSGELERRASDAEREWVVVRLRDASAEGRLTLEELAGRTAPVLGDGGSGVGRSSVSGTSSAWERAE